MMAITIQLRVNLQSKNDESECWGNTATSSSTDVFSSINNFAIYVHFSLMHLLKCRTELNMYVTPSSLIHI